MTHPGLDRSAITRLSDWMRRAVTGAEEGPISATIVHGGRSNLTYFIDQGPRRWVLRRPPTGRLLPSAHDIDREVRVLRALHGSPVPVPDVHAFCADTDVIGAPFYLMSFVPGDVLRTDVETRALTPEQRAAVSDELVRTLVDIHSLPWKELALEDLGRGEGYLERQIQRWHEQWRRSQTRDLPDLERLAEWLRTRSAPTAPRPVLVHGDFRLDNLIFGRSPSLGVKAVLDWEMSTIGDPIADLALLLVYWPDSGGEHPVPSVAPQIAGQPGFATREQLVDRYAALAGADLGGLSFYLAFAYFKLAVILEGIYRRSADVDAPEDARRLRDEVPGLIDRGWEAVEQEAGR